MTDYAVVVGIAEYPELSETDREFIRKAYPW